MGLKNSPVRKQADSLRAFFNFQYPDPKCGLMFNSPFELLVATILSAQCTDVRVNQITPALFKTFPNAFKMARAKLEQLEELVKSCGFFHNKAENILKTSGILVKDYNGEVPGRLVDLIKLPGVGRKTANVVLGNAFGIPGLTVDTHLGRVSRRTGLTSYHDPIKVEQDLMELIPQKDWTLFSHQAISHGRAMCRAQRPMCSDCGFGDCPARQ